MQAETRDLTGGGLPSACFGRWLEEMLRKSLELLLFDAAGTLIEPAEPLELVYQRIFAKFGWDTDAAELRRGFRKTFGELAEPDFSTGDGDAAERAWWREFARGRTSAGAAGPRSPCRR